MAQKTITAKIVAMTVTKQQILQTEYDNLQHFLQTGEDRGVYSANNGSSLQYHVGGMQGSIQGTMNFG